MAQKPSIPIEQGVEVQMEIAKESQRFKTTVVGLEHEQYIIMKLPQIRLADVNQMFAPGKQVTARYIHKGMVLGFYSDILGTTIQPVKLVFIRYPKKVADKNLRSAPRVKCYLPAELQTGKGTVTGYVLDISMNGCRFSNRTTIDTDVDPDDLEKELELRISLPGTQNAITVMVKIKHFKNENETWSYGMQFTGMDGRAKEKLEAYLQESDLFQ